jgi:hypothetical protein
MNKSNRKNSTQNGGIGLPKQITALKKGRQPLLISPVGTSIPCTGSSGLLGGPIVNQGPAMMVKSASLFSTQITKP